jgi:hypothetical protein
MGIFMEQALFEIGECVFGSIFNRGASLERLTDCASCQVVFCRHAIMPLSQNRPKSIDEIADSPFRAGPDSDRRRRDAGPLLARSQFAHFAGSAGAGSQGRRGRGTPGGAANVAVNIATLGGQVRVLGVRAPTRRRRCWKPSCGGWALPAN